MKRSQEIQIKQSELRQRCNELTGKQALDDNERTELDTGMAELAALETQFRAAVKLEADEASEHRSENDGTSAEVSGLESRALLSSYMSAAVEGRAVAGAEAELNAANGITEGNGVPWSAIAPRTEHRADTAITRPSTGNPQSQATILARVFGTGVTAFVGTRMPTVPVGSQSYPVFLTGASGMMAAPGTRVDSQAATFAANILTPKRLSAAYLFSVEDLATTRGIEEALRADLSAVMTEAMDDQVINGMGNTEEVAGFLGGHADSLTAPADEASLVKYQDCRNLLTSQVDGKYASAAGGVKLVMNPKTYQVTDGVYRTDQSEQSGLQAIMAIGGGTRVSSFMPDESATKNSLVLTARGQAGAAVAPVWQGVRFVRDEVTNIASGRVRLTALALFSFKIIRKDNFAAQKVRTTT